MTYYSITYAVTVLVTMGGQCKGSDPEECKIEAYDRLKRRLKAGSKYFPGMVNNPKIETVGEYYGG